MKGNSIFTENEADKIRGLIEEKVKVSSNDQKKIRKEIRRIGFYITDFSNKKGFTTDDFNELIDCGKIEVINN